MKMTLLMGVIFFVPNPYLYPVKKVKKKREYTEFSSTEFDPEVLRMYMMGATNPGYSSKIESSAEVIDLHLENVSTSRGAVAPHDALFVQLDKFEEALDRAIASGKFEFRVVHGFGKGKLKEEIHKILAKHPQVRSFANDYHSKYGHGSTIIYLK